MKFADLSLSEPILRALVAERYETATPIQAKAIPHIMDGDDVMGSAQTGTGKTAAFALPILHRLEKENRPAAPNKPRVLVLCPTRELATQIADGFKAYGANLRIKYTVIFGGVNQRPQSDALRRGVDVCIATPGRLLDLMNQRLVDLRDVHTLVLDEADRMLDMGFIHDIKRITQTLSRDRQTLMFSATMPREIRELAKDLLNQPVSVQVASVTQTADNINQSVYFVQKGNKPQLLAHLYHELPMARAIVFTRTKHGADKVVRHLHIRGIRAEAIHGNKSQNARQRALANFKAMKTPILVATDIAARGIDVDGITHVVNYDLTHEPETYIHRIGRTARAGASGAAVSFCDSDERDNLRAIERLLKKQISVCNEHPEYEAVAPRSSSDDREPRPARAGQSSHGPRDGHRSNGSHSPTGHSRAGNRPAGGHRDSGNRDGAHRQGAPRDGARRDDRPARFQRNDGIQEAARPFNSEGRPAHPTSRPSSARAGGGKPKFAGGKPRQRRRF